MSEILTGAWRARPEPAELPEEALGACLPVLSSTGAAGLAWNRIKGNPDLAASAAGQELRRHAQTMALETTRHTAALGALMRPFERVEAMPLLFKGWAVAQYYAAPHLRTMGDVDLCAPPGRFDEIAELLRRHGFAEVSRDPDARHGRAVMLGSPAGWPGKRVFVDLHAGLGKFYLAPLEEVFARARPAGLDGASLLVPAPEDHLRIVAIHFLRDGGWRPSTLCDVGAVLENLPAGFDWDLCLGEDPRRRHWIGCTLALAHRLLGARPDAVPATHRTEDLPGWLGATALRAWEKPMSHHRARPSFRSVLANDPHQVPREILARWPNGIRASVELDVPFTRLPRWPYQLVFFARAVIDFALRGRQVGAWRDTS